MLCFFSMIASCSSISLLDRWAIATIVFCSSNEGTGISKFSTAGLWISGVALPA